MTETDIDEPRRDHRRSPGWPPLTRWFSARLPEDLAARVVRLAAEDEVPAGEIVRRALRDYCTRHGRDDSSQCDAGVGAPAFAAFDRQEEGRDGP